MTTSPTNLTDLAKQGNPDAIAALMNRLLQPKGITAHAATEGDCLHVRIEADPAPAQPPLVKFVHSGLINLAPAAIRTAQISAYQTGEAVPVWQEQLDLQSPAVECALPPATEDSPELEPIAAPSATSAAQPLRIGAAVLALLLGAGAIAFALTRQPAPPPAPVNTVPLSSSPALPEADLFRSAVNKAMQAANQTQTAATPAEWRQITLLWQEAIDLLGQVPADDANYATAQQKIGEYARNLSYAQQQAGGAE